MESEDEALLCTLICFCQIRLRGLSVFSAASASFVDTVSHFFEVHRLAIHKKQRSLFVTALESTINNACGEVATASERYLVCWLVCHAFQSNAFSLAKLHQACALMQDDLTNAPFSSYLSLTGGDFDRNGCLQRTTPAPIAADLQTAVATEHVQRRENNLPIPAPAALNRDFLQLSASQSSEKAPLNSVFVTIDESREMSQLLLFCARKAKKGKYMRCCCIKRFESVPTHLLLKAATQRKGVDVFFVQRQMSCKVKESLRTEGVFCVDRVGLEAVEKIAGVLQWPIYENLSEWLFASRADPRRSSSKCLLSLKRDSGGITLAIHSKAKVGERQESGASESHYRTQGSECFCLPDTVARFCRKRAQKAAFYGASFNEMMFVVNVATTYMRLRKNKSIPQQQVIVSSVPLNVLFESALGAICLLCRCLM